ncbi:MAG: hypothetical protein SGJ11_01415 [Phycisphaerae bacterium]|nr:hypothetical protein [Phycisphaerae bacterium]
MSLFATIFFRPALPPLFIALAALALGALAWFTYRRAMAISPPLRWTLFGVRILTIITLAVLLLGPSHMPPQRESDAPMRVTVLVDVSESMATTDCDGRSRFDALRQSWLRAARLDEFAAAASIDLRSFGARTLPATRAAVALLDTASLTDDRTTLVSAVEAMLGPLSASASDQRANGHRMLVLSDGRDTSGAAAGPIAEAARARGIPVDTVCVGASVVRRDIAVEAMLAQDYLFTAEDGELIVRVRQTGLSLDTVDVEISADDGEPLHLPMDLRGRTHAELRVPIRHEEPGQYRYLVRVEARAEEIDVANNAQLLFADVSKAQTKVLMLEGRPSWDMKFIAQSLRKDPRIRIVQVSRLSETRIETIVSGGDALEEAAPPDLDDAAAIADFDLFVLGAGVEHLLKPHTAAALRDRVERGGGVIFARGCAYRTGAQGASDRGCGVATALHPIEPVIFRADSAADRVRSPHVAITPSGAAMPWFAPGRLGVDLVGGGDALPAWSFIQRIDAVKPGAIVLASVRIDGDTNPEDAAPAIVSMRAGHGIALTILGEGMWRWSLVDHDRDRFAGAYERCWQGMARWATSAGDTRPGEDVTLRVSQQSVQRGKQVTADVFMDHRLEDVTAALHVERPDGAVQPLALSTSAAGANRLSATFTADSVGLHTLVLETPDATPSTQRRLVNVTDSAPERADTSADAGTMRALAERSGGRAFAVSESGEYPNFLRERRRMMIPSAEATWIWNRFLFLVMLCGVLGLEWVVRRKAGLA